MANDVKIRLAMEGAAVVSSEIDRVNTSLGKMRSGSDTVGQSLSGLQSSVANAKGALIGLGAIGLAVAFAANIKGAIDLADSLNKLSQRTSVSTENMSQMQYAAKLSDVSNETLTNSYKKLNVSIAQGLAGDKEKIGLFKSLGISTADLGKGTQEVMMKIADAYAKARDGAGKVAVGNGLMGKTADEMIPFLNGGRQGITDLMKEADKLGLTIGSEFAKQAEEFNDNLARVQISSQKLSIALAGDLVEGLGKAMKAMSEATVEGGKLAGIIAGIQTLLTGDDRHKNNVALVEGTEKLLQAEKALDAARAAGMNPAGIAARQKWVDEINAGLKTTLSYRKLLTEEDDKAAAASAKVEDARKKAAELRLSDTKAGAAAAAKERARLLEQDRKSWVDLAEFKIKEYEDELAAQNKLDEERNAYADKMRAEDLKGWVAYAEARVNEDFDMAKQLADQQIEELKRVTDARDKVAAEQQKTVDQYDDIFRTGFADMLNGGKGAWKSFTTSLVTTFKTSVADQIYKMFMQPFVVKMVGSLLGMVGGTMGGVANAATGAAGGGAGSGIMSGLGMATSALGTGFAGGLAAWGAGGSIMGSLSAGASLLGTGTMAGGMAGAGMIVGALAPIALGIGALVAISKATQGETRSGADYTINPVTGQITQGYTVSGGELAGKDVRGGISATASNINTRFAAIGSDSRLTGFQAGLNTSDRGRGGVFSGGTLSTGATFGETGIGDAYKGTKFEKTSTMSPDAKTAAENFFTDLNQVAIQALQVASGVPKSIRALIDGVDAESLSAADSAALIGRVDAVITSVTSFGEAAKLLPFKDLKTMSFDAAAGLIEAAGGLEALGSTLGSYYTNFYSAAEQTAQLADNTATGFASLGLTMPAVNEGLADWYRTQVDAAMALDQSIPANAQATASLLSLNGSVATLATGAKSAADSIRDAVAGISATVDSSLFGMQYGMADDPGKYNMLDVQAATYNDKMLAETDPLKIADYGQKTMDSMAKAWGLLNHDQQVASYAAYEARYEAIDTFVTQRGADALSLQGARDDKTAKTIADAVKTAVSDAMEAATQRIKDAAAVIATAAAQPVKSDVTLVVTLPPGQEASIMDGG